MVNFRARVMGIRIKEGYIRGKGKIVKVEEGLMIGFRTRD